MVSSPLIFVAMQLRLARFQYNTHPRVRILFSTVSFKNLECKNRLFLATGVIFTPLFLQRTLLRYSKGAFAWVSFLMPDIP